MKNIAIAALAALAVCASAGPKIQKTIACAVMPNNKVDIAKATKNHMYADYKGHRYFFCCGGCPAAFKANPAKYAKAASIKTPVTPKKGKKAA
ncbi:MAG TPA: YHS domain-containing protein [Fimbriimonas sp.]|nr:YHS domain-containing protein [Fimbriimonas sp.]